MHSDTEIAKAKQKLETIDLSGANNHAPELNLIDM